MTLRQIGFLMDPIESINPKKDTTLHLIRAAQKLGMQPYYIQPDGLYVHNGTPFVYGRKMTTFEGDDPYFEYVSELQKLNLDVLMMRIDPPFNMAYIYCTYVLDLLVKNRVLVINTPQALRNFNEKFVLTHFPDIAPPTLISSNATRAKQFAAQFDYCILKPLDGMGGEGVLRLQKSDPNFDSAFELLSNNGKVPIMAQQYLAEIADGDKRVFIINGEAQNACLNRKPAAGEIRANLASGGTGIAQLLSNSERTIANKVADKLLQFGVYFAGLDMIGNYVTEINITSPTGTVQIKEQMGVDIAEQFFIGIETTALETLC